VDSSTKIIKDYVQYRFNLTKANSEPDVETPKWDIAYRATEHFNVTYLNDYESLSAFSERILTDKNNFNKIMSSFFTGSPLINQYLSNSKMARYLSCRFTKDIFDDYYKCIGYITWDPEEYAYKLINVIEGSWFKKLPN
jgi:hypothetical protein